MPATSPILSHGSAPSLPLPALPKGALLIHRSNWKDAGSFGRVIIKSQDLVGRVFGQKYGVDPTSTHAALYAGNGEIIEVNGDLRRYSFERKDELVGRTSAIYDVYVYEGVESERVMARAIGFAALFMHMQQRGDPRVGKYSVPAAAKSLFVQPDLSDDDINELWRCWGHWHFRHYFCMQYAIICYQLAGMSLHTRLGSPLFPVPSRAGVAPGYFVTKLQTDVRWKHQGIYVTGQGKR